MEWIPPLLSVFGFSTLLSLTLVPVMKTLAFRFDVLDHPGYHKTHENVHPLLGGGAIYGTFMSLILCGVVLLAAANLGWLAAFPALQRTLSSQTPLFAAAWPRLAGLVLGGTFMFLLGLMDDLRGVGFSYKLKFLGQIVAAILVIASGIRLEFLPHPTLNVVVTLLWIVGITNAFNLLDNMDGLSSGVAVIAALILSVLTIRQGQYFSALLLLALAGSMLGFLRYNFNPSSIFMGDAGSLFIGFTLAVLTVSNSYVTTSSVSKLPVVVPVLVLGVPLFDTFSVMVIRCRQRRPLFVGDNCHFSHRLVKLGMSVRQAVGFIYLVSVCIGLSAILIPELSVIESGIVLLQEGLIFGLITLLMIKGDRLRLLHHALEQDLENIRAVNSSNGKAVAQK